MSSNKRIEEMLQQCLEGYEAGLTPEQCLSAFPERRAELEPLFRQALSLRVAYANTPSAEFRELARERFLFAAGRDVSAAFASRPDPEFVSRARRRLIREAGAPVQEALRAVPPPRLPFWSNTRRRLLEAAQAQQARRSAPARPSPVLAWRTGLSAAVVVFAMAIAGLAYMTSSGGGVNSVNAEFAALERDLAALEAQARAGQTPSEEVLSDIARRTRELASQLETQPSSPYTERLPEILERGQQALQLATTEGLISPELAQAAAQFEEAEAKVDEIRQASTRATETPTSAVAAAAPSQTAEPSQTAAAASATPQASSTAATSPTPLPADYVRVTSLPDDDTYGLKWKQVESANISLIVPEDWQLIAVQLDANGVGSAVGGAIRIDAPGLILLVTTGDGVIQGIINGQLVLLREADGDVIEPDELIQEAGELALQLTYVLESVELSGDLLPSPTPSVTPSPSPSATGTP